MANDRTIWIGTAIDRKEIDDIININLIKMKIGVKGIILRGILKYFEEIQEKTDDKNIKRELDKKILRIKEILGTL